MMNPVAKLESLYPYFESLGEGIAVLDRDGRVISINGTAARLLGLGSPKDAQGPLEELSDAFTVSGEPIPAEERPGRLALHGHFVRGYEAALWPKGAAKAHFVTISTASIPDEEGQTAQIIVSCREVNERRKTDETRARLAAIVESSEDAIVGKDLNGVVTAWNRGAERLFGYTAEEMVGQSIRRLLLPGDEAEEDDIMRRISRGETIQHSERRRRKKNGEIVEVSVTISPIRNGRGEIVGASKIARDITETRRTADALHESREQLTRILESAMDAIITVDERQRVLFFNAAAERMFLCPQSAALGSSLDRFIPPRFRATHSEHIRSFSSTGMTNRAMGELGYLAELGYTVIRAADGVAALAAIERNDEIDLMVTDIIMPGGLNGIDLAKQVRKLRPGIKIIFTSGFPAEALSERSGKLEGGPLLHKPYLRAEFADMVRKSMSARPGMA